MKKRSVASARRVPVVRTRAPIGVRARGPFRESDVEPPGLLPPPGRSAALEQQTRRPTCPRVLANPNRRGGAKRLLDIERFFRNVDLTGPDAREVPSTAAGIAARESDGSARRP